MLSEVKKKRKKRRKKGRKRKGKEGKREFEYIVGVRVGLFFQKSRGLPKLGVTSLTRVLGNRDDIRDYTWTGRVVAQYIQWIQCTNLSSSNQCWFVPVCSDSTSEELFLRTTYVSRVDRRTSWGRLVVETSCLYWKLTNNIKSHFIKSKSFNLSWDWKSFLYYSFSQISGWCSSWESRMTHWAWRCDWLCTGV